MQDTEINKIEDARLLGIIDKISAKDKPFEVYKKELEEAIQKAEMIGMRACGTSAMADYAPIQMPTDEILRETHAYSSREDHIIDSSILLLQDRERSVNNERKPVQEDWKINEIGQHIADGPGLTVLDGGPGAGKSFSLSKAVDVMQVPVICLGSTASAAAGLKKDMKDAERPEAIASDIKILGGLTVDQLLQKTPLEDKDLQAEKEKVLQALNGTPKPCVMVDEAGLLGHEQMEKLLKFAEENGTKLILAGDCQQIPEGNGQPFKMIAESVKGTPAYVNAPYVFRQSDFIEKAITSGIYHGNDAADINKTKDMATEFMIAAYDVGEPKIKETVNGEEFKFTLEDRLNEKYPGKPKDEAVALYVTEMAGKAKTLTPEKLQETINKGLSLGADGTVDREAYDTYVCAALACQALGVRAYEQKGQIKEVKEDIYTNVAADFAQNYVKSLEDGLKSRQKKAEKDGETPPTEHKYADGMLAITATTEEAKELNAAIRAKMIEQGKLPEKEPVIINGDRKLLSQAEIAAAQEAAAQGKGPEVQYAYALDVKTTQGMSQNGKVSFVVRGDTMNQMHGGEILVGATRHKENFEIKMDEAAAKRKDEFYKASTQQYASRRIIHKENQATIRNAAMNESPAKTEKPVKAEEPKKKGLQNSISACQSAQETEEPKKKGLQNNISACQSAQTETPEKGNQAIVRKIQSSGRNG